MRLSLLALTGLLASAFAQYDGARCGAPDPSASLVREADSQLAEEDAGRGDVLFQPIIVNTYIHFVTTEAAKNNYTQAQIDAQMAYMNDAYGPWNITFSVNSTDFTVNELWANSTYGSSYELAMKTALRKGGYRDLNLYFLSNLGGGLLGVCRFPVDNPTVTQLALDGCVNLAGSIPGGNVPTYDLGGTAAHETGHWLVFSTSSRALLALARATSLGILLLRGLLLGVAPSPRTAAPASPASTTSTTTWITRPISATRSSPTARLAALTRCSTSTASERELISL